MPEFKNILITGGTGFIGTNLILELHDEYKFINLGRNKNSNCDNVYWDLYGDIPEKDISKKIDVIIHCASIVSVDKSAKDTEYIDINVKSTLRLLQFGMKRGITQFIYISTGGVYGFCDEEIEEDNICRPEGIYSMTKYFSEILCRDYIKYFRVSILRLFFPYGKRQNGRLISNLIYNISNYKEVILNEGGLPLINPVRIHDICKIIGQILKLEINGTYNVSGNEVISIRSLCDLIQYKLKVSNVKYVYSGIETSNLIGSNKKLLRELDYCFKVRINDGIDEIINSTNSDMK